MSPGLLVGEGAGGHPSYPSEDSLKVQLLVNREDEPSHRGGRAVPRLPVPPDPSLSGPLGSVCFPSVHQMNRSRSLLGAHGQCSQGL